MIKTIHIPRLNLYKRYPVKIFSGKTFFTQSEAVLTLRNQSLGGLNIPKDSEIRVCKNDLAFNHNKDEAYVRGEDINKLLKYIYLEKLRNYENKTQSVY